jgi:assimilatory nitrate reductase catalytic subunit
MILCLCNGVSDKTVIEQAKEGKSLKEIQQSTSVGSDCGSCLRECKRIHKENKKGE